MAIIRNVVVRIGADITQFEKGMKSAQRQLKGIKDLSTNMMKYITLSGIALGGLAIKAGMEFEQAMSGVQAVSGATADQMERLKEMAMDLGASTKFSAKEAAQGIEELLKAGLSVEQVLGGGLAGALNLAAAGDIELAESAEIVSTALNAFKADGLSSARVADILAGTANASATSVQELKMGLAQTSAVASGFGMSFEDTNTALGIFANNGLKGSDAGTSLKSMLMRLQPKTKEQTKLFKQLNLVNAKGVSLFYDENEQLKDLDEIAGTLRKSMEGLTDAQRMSYLETMFGTDAIRAANILYKEGAEGVKKMKIEMNKVTAEEVAAVKMDNLKGKIEELKGSLETLGIKLYETNDGPLKDFVGLLDGIVDNLNEMDSKTLQTGTLLLGLYAAAGVGIFVFAQLQAAFLAVAGAAGTAAAPLLRLFGIMGMLAFVALDIVNNWEEVKKSWELTWKVMQDAAYDAAEGIVEDVYDILSALDYLMSFIPEQFRWGDDVLRELDKVRAKLKILRSENKDTQGEIRHDIDVIRGDTPSRADFIKQEYAGLASGGIVTGPTLAMIGEGREDEAVLPLSKLSRMLDLSGKQSVENYHRGTIKVEGVNNQGELIGIAEIIADKGFTEDRRVPSRVRLLPIG